MEITCSLRSAEGPPGRERAEQAWTGGSGRGHSPRPTLGRSCVCVTPSAGGRRARPLSVSTPPRGMQRVNQVKATDHVLFQGTPPKGKTPYYSNSSSTSSLANN